MQAKNPKIHVERSFYRSLLALTLPVALQNVISYSVNLMDTLMLGGLGEVALSATSLANQVFFIYTVAIFGVAGGAIVLCSQYWGKKDVDSICRVASLALRISAAAGLLFTLVLFLFPRPVMQIFTAEPAVIEAGASYLRIVSLSYFFYGVTSTFLVVLRSVETVNVSVAIYGVSFAVNVFFNYVFIFGKFGAPRMGVAGAAVGTVLARVAEFVMIIAYMLVWEKKIRFRLHMLLWPSGGLARDPGALRFARDAQRAAVERRHFHALCHPGAYEQRYRGGQQHLQCDVPDGNEHHPGGVQCLGRSGGHAGGPGGLSVRPGLCQQAHPDLRRHRRGVRGAAAGGEGAGHRHL